MINLKILPLTQERWADFETLFGPNGACYGCWCMWWRQTNKEFSSTRAPDHKEAMRTLVQQGVETGLIAYVDGIPAGWVTVAPRADFIRLKTSRLYAPVDDQIVWSIPCFFVSKVFRKQGLTSHLIRAAEDYAKLYGASILEAYPSDPEGRENPMNIYKGVCSTFLAAGFQEVARRKEARPIFRKTLN